MGNETEAGGRDEMLLNIDYLDGSLSFTSKPLGYDVAAIYALGWKLVVNSGDLGWYKTPKSASATVKLDVLDAASANRRDRDILVLPEDGDLAFEVSSPHAYLFRVDDDESEQNNVAADHPDVVEALQNRLLDHRLVMEPCEWRDDDATASDFFQKDGFVGPWWHLDAAPPPLSENCANIGDHTVDRFKLPEADVLNSETPESESLAARRTRRLS